MMTHQRGMKYPMFFGCFNTANGHQRSKAIKVYFLMYVFKICIFFLTMDEQNEENKHSSPSLKNLKSKSTIMHWRVTWCMQLRFSFICQLGYYKRTKHKPQFLTSNLYYICNNSSKSTFD